MRTIAISASLAELLRAEVELMRLRQELRPGWNPEDLLFPNREGNREANEVANRWLKRACEAAGVPVLTMHGLRHTAGSQASAAGIAPNIIKERLGHSMSRPRRCKCTSMVVPDSGQHQDAADALEASVGFDSTPGVPRVGSFGPFLEVRRVVAWVAKWLVPAARSRA
jgi:hypothetical protein